MMQTNMSLKVKYVKKYDSTVKPPTNTRIIDGVVYELPLILSYNVVCDDEKLWKSSCKVFDIVIPDELAFGNMNVDVLCCAVNSYPDEEDVWIETIDISTLKDRIKQNALISL
jgi:hypothetical protein